MRSAALRSASMSRQTGSAHSSSSVAVSSRLSTIQAPQVSALSIGSSPGSFTSSHCRGSPGSGMTTVSKSSRIRKPAVSIWRNSFSVGWTWASASSRSSRP